MKVEVQDWVGNTLPVSVPDGELPATVKVGRFHARRGTDGIYRIEKPKEPSRR